MMTPSSSDIHSQLLAFLTESFPLFDSSLPETSPITEYGIDSLGITEIVLYIEDHFKIQIEDSDLTRANLGTLQAIWAFIERKLEG